MREVDIHSSSGSIFREIVFNRLSSDCRRSSRLCARDPRPHRALFCCDPLPCADSRFAIHTFRRSRACDLQQSAASGPRIHCRRPQPGSRSAAPSVSGLAIHSSPPLAGSPSTAFGSRARDLMFLVATGFAPHSLLPFPSFLATGLGRSRAWKPQPSAASRHMSRSPSIAFGFATQKISGAAGITICSLRPHLGSQSTIFGETVDWPAEPSPFTIFGQAD